MRRESLILKEKRISGQVKVKSQNLGKDFENYKLFQPEQMLHIKEKAKNLLVNS